VILVLGLLWSESFATYLSGSGKTLVNPKTFRKPGIKGAAPRKNTKAKASAPAPIAPKAPKFGGLRKPDGLFGWHISPIRPVLRRPPYNKKTMRVIRDALAGKNLLRYATAEEMFEDFGV